MRNAFPVWETALHPCKVAFPVWETALHPCKVLSRFGKRLYTLAKCFPGLGNDFTPLQDTFPTWETILHLLGNCFDKTVIF
ncbi:hypothetical protein DXA15_17745 [Parabacteroides sp. AM58-2XD]|nr:hypothetical protein DXA15_17745 [Parabacteroides sp. AM58-2XD]